MIPHLLCIILLILQSVDAAPKPYSGLRLGVWTPSNGSLAEKSALQNLEIFGIPFQQNTRFPSLTECQAILIPGPLPEALLDFMEVRSIYQYVEGGGVVFLSGNIGKSLFTLAGFGQTKPSSRRFNIRIAGTADDPILHYINRPEEFLLAWGSPDQQDSTFQTFAAISPSGNILATYDDRSAAFTRYQFGKGLVYYLGLSWEHLVGQPRLDARSRPMQKNSGVDYKLACDMFILLEKAFYENYIIPSITYELSPVPYTTALLLSHDVTTRDAFRNALDFATLEKNLGLKATFFFSTRTFSDYLEPATFTPENRKFVATLAEMGSDIGSRGVSNLRTSTPIPLGQKLTTKDEYHPEKDRTLIGECLISRWLLEENGANVIAFRAGGLVGQPNLYPTLQTCGYSLSSSRSADDAPSTFPYYLQAQDTQLLEIPVSLDPDALLGSSLSGRPGTLLSNWISSIEQGRENGGINTLNLATHVSGERLKLLQTLLAKLADRGVWIGGLEEYYRFFNLRRQISIVEMSYTNNMLRIRFGIPCEKIPPEFSLSVRTPHTTRRIIFLDSRDRPLRFTQIRNGELLRLTEFNTGAKYAGIQKKFIFSLGLLLMLFISGMGIALLLKKFRSRSKDKGGKFALHEESVLAILAATSHRDDKLRELRKLGKVGATRDILLAQTEFLRGSEAEELGYLYFRMQFFRQDVRLTRDERYWKRAEAAYALGHFAVPESEIHLLMLLHDKHAEVRIAAATALGKLKLTTKIPRILEAVLKSDPWTGNRMLQGLLPMKMEASEALRSMLNNPNLAPELMRSVARALGTLRDIGGVSILIKHLNNGDTELTLTILEALRKIGDETVLDKVSLLFESENPDIRMAVLKTLSGLGNPLAIPFIMKIVDQAPIPIAREGMRSLATLGERGRDQLTNLLYNERPELSLLALQIIEESGLFEIIAKEATNADDRQKQRNAERFLRRIHTLGFRRYLDDLIETYNHNALSDIILQH